MNEREANERKGADKVYRACALASADCIRQEWECRIEPGRHSQSRDNQQWYEHEQHDQVRKPLQDVVMLGFLPAGKAQKEMIAQRRSCGTQLPRGWNKVAPYVSAKEAIKQIAHAIKNQKPSEKEVPAPADGEVLITRQRQPGWKSLLVFVCRARQAQETRGIEGKPENFCHPDSAVFLLCCTDRGNRPCKVGSLTEIERRMSIENLQAAQEQ